MIDIIEAIERIKDILSHEIPDRMIYDKDVAKALDLSASTLAAYKKRDKLPYHEINTFCFKRHISINAFYYNQPIHLLEKNPINKTLAINI